MTRNSSKYYHTARPRRGFALLITIVLLAFLVLLLVALSSLTRVETQVAANQTQMLLARQNALLGLRIALGQLQKYAGPDQRVTATADLNSTANTTIANPHYTGVWDVAAVNAAAKINIPCSPDTHGDPADINHDNPVKFSYTPLPNPTTPSVWLVSGNENPANPLAVNYATVTSGNSSCITLVGNATTTVNSVADSVQVPTVPITSASIPGHSGTATTIGKFAYWVGDEGVKAKFNVIDPYTPTPSFTPTAIQAYCRQATSQRNGIEQMSIDGTSTAPATTPIGADYNPTADTAASAQLLGNLGNVVAYTDTQLVSYPDPVTTFNPSTVFKNRYWDLTTSSYGILTDTANGGLKYDLTWDFSQAQKSGLLTGPIVQAVTWMPSWPAPGPGEGWYPPWVSTANHLDPQWSVLRGFYRLTPALSPTQFDPSTGDVILSSAQGTPRNNENVMPVLTQVRLYWGVHADYNSDGTVNGSPLAKQYVLFLVANPYDMPLSVPNGLNFHVITWGNNIDMAVKNGTTTWTSFELFYDLPDSGWFCCPKALTFQPGEVKAFVLSADVPYSSTGLGPSPLESVTDTPDFNSQNPHAITVPLSSPKTASKAVTGWQVTLSLSDEDTGYGAVEMLSKVPNTADTSATGTQTLAWINTFSFALPATGTGTTGNSTTPGMGSYTSNNNVTSGTPTTSFYDPSGSTDFDIGGMVFSLKMPAEAGYTSSTAIRFLADYNTRNETMGSYAGDALTLYYSYYQPDSDSFLQNIAPPTWGLSSSSQTGTDLGAILYHIPRPPSGAPAWEPVILSIADLQNANVTTTAQEPTYAIGNSYASVFCQPERSVSWPQANNVSQSRSNPSWRYDMSYLCNEALWDTYYFSTVPQTSVSAGATYNPRTDTLPDSRYVPAPGPLGFSVLNSANKVVDAAGAIPQQRDFTASSVSAAALLRVNGAFNVNSTSVEAWKAVFSSLRGTDYTAPDGTSTDTNLSGPFFRTLWQTHGKTDPPASLWANAQTGTDMNSWTGFRNLSPAEVDALAAAMVAQVRLRGPFRSLGDFVNRRLPSSDMTPVSDPDGLSLRGALQAAIDAAGINSQFNSNPNPSGSDQADGNDVTNAYSNQTNTTDLSWSFMTPANAVGNRATGAPGWLMQADVLQAIGATLSDRSDTFVIRSYGEAVNPVTGVTTGKAWCEAVVQRVPDYVDPANAPTVAPAPAITLTSNTLTTTVTSNSLINSLTTLTALNQTFGRRFKIVSFRWLSPDDI